MGTGYLDHNATTPLKPQALKAMTQAWQEVGNPSASHACGQRQNQNLELYRQRFLDYLHTPTGYQTIWTSGATESNALVLRSFSSYTTFVIAGDHPSLTAYTKAIPLPLQPSGQIDFDAFTQAISKVSTPFLLAMQIAHGVTGFVHDVRPIIQHVHSHGGYILLDGAQCLGKMPLAHDLWNADFISFSAHKVGGPLGVGALVISPRSRECLQPIFYKGRQELGYRAGTPPVPLIAGFVAALPQPLPCWKKWQDDCRTWITDHGGSIIGHPHLSNTLCILMPHVQADTQVLSMDMAGISLGMGHACSSPQPLPIAITMGYSKTEALCMVRMSMGWTTTLSDVENFCYTWKQIQEKWGKP